VKAILEVVLKEAQREAIGAEWHQRNVKRKDYRNGYRGRVLGCSYGDISIRVPRNRKGSYPQAVFDRFSRRTAQVEEEILLTFSLGVSVRGMSRVLGRRGLGLSPQGVANVLKQVDVLASQWHRRPLSDDRYRFIILDAMWVRLGKDLRALLMAEGVLRDGQTELIDYRVAEGETEGAWGEFLQEVYERGLEGKATEAFVSDGAQAIETAVQENYPRSAHQICAFHKVQDIAGHLIEKGNRKRILREAARIYRAVSAEKARIRAKVWAGRWQKREPEAVRTFLLGFEKTLVFYQFEPEVWKKIRTTNLLERYLRELRRRLKGISSYRNEESIDRMVYLAISGIKNRGYPYNTTNKITHRS
jgi:putative transposase